MTPEHAEQPKHNKSACQNTESNGQTSDSDTNWVLAVDVKRLRGPEEQDGEKVCSGDEGDDKRKDEDTGVLL